MYGASFWRRDMAANVEKPGLKLVVRQPKAYLIPESFELCVLPSPTSARSSGDGTAH